MRFEGWYLSYALLGLSAAGLVPILLPLDIGRSAGAGYIGLVMAAFNLGGLSAPLWGWLADRFRIHRWLLVGGLVGTAAGAATFPAVPSLAVRTMLAFLTGIGLASASTTANLFIVEMHPRAEWDARIGWLQTFYGSGQVIGLVLAGLIGRTEPAKGLWLAGAISVAAILPAFFGTWRERALLTERRPVLSRPAHHAEWPVGSPQHLYHYLRLNGLGKVLSAAGSPFGLFLAAWSLGFSGSAAIFSLYPIVMQQQFGVLPGRSAAGYAFAAALGLFLYAPAGAWSAARGPLPMLRGALGLRTAAFLALTVLAIAPVPGRGWLAMFSFLFVVLAWSVLSVSSSALVAALSPEKEGEAMGIFNAATSFSGVVGAAVGGWSAGRWGYATIPVLGLLGAASGLLITFKLPRKCSTCEEAHA